MRTPNLQYLYLQKPITFVVVLCAISILPWILTGDFATKGEPREAAVAISMLESGNWMLPQVYADEFAYKPPLAHWLMAVLSYPQGYVSEFTSRLPSAIAYIVLIASTLIFFGKRIKFHQTFVSVLLLMTSLEIHRAGMSARVDMLLTAFMVFGLYRLYKWEDEMHLKGLPAVIPLLLSCAILTKGPVGVILPLFVFAVYLLALRKYSLLTIFKSVSYIGVASLFIPLLWYISAWRQGGEAFFDLVLAENFGRFFSMSDLDINYNLGHENGVLYNFQTLITGFIPWTLLVVFSIFGIKFSKPGISLRKGVAQVWKRFLALDKITLFSVITLVCIIFFYSIPSSKRSVYLMPAYPFIALFLAQYSLYLAEYRRYVMRFFAGFLVFLVTLLLFSLAAVSLKLIDPMVIAGQYLNDGKTLEIVQVFTNVLISPSWLTVLVLLLNVFAVVVVWYQLFKKINIKILYATIGLVFTANMLADGVIMLNYRNYFSSKEFAKQITHEYPLTENNVYVMNNLLEYQNLYGLNFYMGNMFQDFADTNVGEGYFLTVGKDVEKVLKNNGDQYDFTLLTSTEKRIADVRDKILLYKFKRK